MRENAQRTTRGTAKRTSRKNKAICKRKGQVMSEEKETIVPRIETIRTLAKESGVSYNCIRLWCLNGKLPYIKTGKKYLINVNSFVKLLENER